MSALAVAVLIKVNTEQRLQKTDSGNNLAYYGAEAGMEKIMADLDDVYARKAAPNWCDIASVQTLYPALADIGVTYSQYRITILPDPPGPPTTCTAPPQRVQTISQGPSAGLMALVVPLTLRVAADRPSGEQVSLTRNIEVAEVPVFQFGFFSETDLAFFPATETDLSGRVQTNHNLYMTPSDTLTFHGQLRAAGDVVRDEMPNGISASSQGRTGNVMIPTAPNGCEGTSPPACRNLKQSSPNEGSSAGGPILANCAPGAATSLCNGTAISGWQTVSPSTYHSMILSGSTGAKALTMAFVKPGVGPIEIIRRPLSGESATSLLGESRLYNEAQIRVLLSDDPAELPATLGFAGATDPQNIRLANVKTNANAPDYSNGVPVPGGTGNTYFAEGTTGTTTTANLLGGSVYEYDWAAPAAIPSAYATMPASTPQAPTYASGTPTKWNLLDGYLRVEVRKSDGTFLPVTKEWLELGFARRANFPGASAGNVCSNGTETCHPNAILILQQQADRNGDGTATRDSDSVKELLKDATANSYVRGTATRTNWYPLNFYDAREGEWRSPGNINGTASVRTGGSITSPTCYVNGVMNSVEIDVANLRRWLLGTIGANGTQTESVSQNGYVLYFSDRRGMLPNPNATPTANLKNGEYGFEDTVNNTNVGTPNGALDAGEDVNGSGTLDTWGKMNIGYGFGLSGSGLQNPGQLISCVGTNSSSGLPHPAARKNWVSGARHSVRLVHGSLGNVPTKSDGRGGFTLASENPAYVLGDYNANSAASDLGYGSSHAASAVIADTVTLLSNSFSDLATLWNPACAEDSSACGSTAAYRRSAATTSYRMAIAAGKSMNYPYPGYSTPDEDAGLDGGAHNFLRYLEDWYNTNSMSHYLGSMVSLYYSMYATGTFKCCGMAVYDWPYNPSASPSSCTTTPSHCPGRDYRFDSDFLDLTKMPPGTPTFRDVVNVGFQQVF
ncbi:MAG: hypothetical protein LAO06_09825 [Acidobacteriia bacterium]|nr:hypothetical protein [Terriglobia bacterium]